MDESIGEMIKRARADAGMSQSELAKMLATRSGNRSITRDSVKRWESGKRIPRPRARWQLSESLRLPIDDLEAGARQARRNRGTVPEQARPDE